MGHYFAEMNPSGKDDRGSYVADQGFNMKNELRRIAAFRKHKEKIQAKKKKHLEKKICELLTCKEEELKIVYEILKKKFDN